MKYEIRITVNITCKQVILMVCQFQSYNLHKFCKRAENIV